MTNRLKVYSLLFASISWGQAATIARWTPVSTALPRGVDYDNGADQPLADETIAGVAASVLNREGFANAFGNTGAVFPGRAADGAAVDGMGGFTSLPAQFTSFTLTPDAGMLLSVDTITYDYASYGQAEAGSGYLVTIRTSADGFATDLASASTSVTSARLTLDTSALGTLTSATEFRVYAAAIDANGGNRWFDLVGSDVATDAGLIVDGTVTAVPEPSSSLLLGLAG